MHAHYLVNKIVDTDTTPERQEFNEVRITLPVTNIIIMVRNGLVAKELLIFTMLKGI